MFQKIKKYFIETDYVLFAAALLISAIGVIAIYSSGYNPVTGEADAYYKRQLMWLSLGVISFFIMSYVNYRKVIRMAPLIYILGLLMLLLVLVLGHIGMGAQRWIGIGPIRVQPSEIFKTVWIITLAWVFMDFDGVPMGIVKIIKKSWILIPPFMLVFLQPDLGTSLTYVAVWGLVILILGVKKEVFLIAVVLIAVLIPVAWMNMYEYQQDRVKIFFGIIEDEKGIGWHSKQSKVAVGSGGINGKGFLGGTQSHLNFLPESHTDFIFSVINEEKGLIGGSVVTVLFLFLLFRIFSISIKHKEASGKILTMAAACYVFFQFIVNAGMTVGLVPVVGIPMPFVSYGGTSLLSFFTMLGIVNSVNLRQYSITD